VPWMAFCCISISVSHMAGEVLVGDAHVDCECCDPPVTRFISSDFEWLQTEQTPSRWPPKRSRIITSEWTGSNRRGLQQVATTLFNVHNREAALVLRDALPPEKVLKQLFRCRGFDNSKQIDPRLVEIVVKTALHFEAPRTEIISGFRSPKFNDLLAKKGRRVAAESKHTLGQAIDFRLSTAHARRVGAWVWKNFDGGLGIYSKDDFIHVDVGRKRRWMGK
jgi:uncharacterized protein YcbK (DUF882 family)